MLHVDKHNYTRKLTNDGDRFETINPIKSGAVSYGDCMIGTTGDLFTVAYLKQQLLKLNCNTWTVTLDMCRNDPGMRGSSNGMAGKRSESIRIVELP